jgi:hypothetical protein
MSDDAGPALRDEIRDTVYVVTDAHGRPVSVHRTARGAEDRVARAAGGLNIMIMNLAR